MTSCKHTQIGYLMLVVFLAVLAIFTWVYITASTETLSVNSGPNFVFSATMLFILFVLASFITLTTLIDESYLRVKFGYGIFSRKFALNQITSA